MKTGDVVISKSGKISIAFEAGEDGVVNPTFCREQILSGKRKKLMLSIDPDHTLRIFRYDDNDEGEDNTGINIYDILKEALEDVS